MGDDRLGVVATGHDLDLVPTGSPGLVDVDLDGHWPVDTQRRRSFTDRMRNDPNAAGRPYVVARAAPAADGDLRVERIVTRHDVAEEPRARDRQP